jgi:hypothetical protein
LGVVGSGERRSVDFDDDLLGLTELEKRTDDDEHAVTRLVEIPVAWARNSSEQWADTMPMISPSSSSPATKEPPCSPSQTTE